MHAQRERDGKRIHIHPFPLCSPFSLSLSHLFFSTLDPQAWVSSNFPRQISRIFDVYLSRQELRPKRPSIPELRSVWFSLGVEFHWCVRENSSTMLSCSCPLLLYSVSSHSAWANPTEDRPVGLNVRTQQLWRHRVNGPAVVAFKWMAKPLDDAKFSVFDTSQPLRIYPRQNLLIYQSKAKQMLRLLGRMQSRTDVKKGGKNTSFVTPGRFILLPE